MLRVLVVFLFSISATVTHAAIVASATLRINNLFAEFTSQPNSFAFASNAFLSVELDGTTQTSTSSSGGDSLYLPKSSTAVNSSFTRSGDLSTLPGRNGSTLASLNAGGVDEFGGGAISKLTTSGTFTLNESQVVTISFDAKWDRSSDDPTRATAETLVSILLTDDNEPGINLLSDLDTSINDALLSERIGTGLPRFTQTINLAPGSYSFSGEQISRINLSAVPEPASIVGLGAILLGTTVVHRRKRSRLANA